MFRHASFLAIAIMAWNAPVHAATEGECLSLWKTADVDANGALTRDEDKAGYVGAAMKSGQSLAKPDTLSRDEFLQLCQGNAFAGLQGGGAAAIAQPTPGPAASRDIGKGDLTPASSALSEADARSKLTANGFKDVQSLSLDKQGIWRGTAVFNGQRQDVAIDAQGDIVGKGQTAQAQRKESQPPSTAGTTQSLTVARGHAGTGGFPVWTFLLIGNAVALIVLSSMTSGGTSAMSSRTSDPFV